MSAYSGFMLLMAGWIERSYLQQQGVDVLRRIGSAPVIDARFYKYIAHSPQVIANQKLRHHAAGPAGFAEKVAFEMQHHVEACRCDEIGFLQPVPGKNFGHDRKRLGRIASEKGVLQDNPARGAILEVHVGEQLRHMGARTVIGPMPGRSFSARESPQCGARADA